jgi:hypothetical protein
MTSLSPIDAWVLARLLSNAPVYGELKLMSSPVRPLGELMVNLQHSDRSHAWQCALALRPDSQAFRRAVADADPNAPPPTSKPQAFATAADVRRLMAQIRWEWEGWIPKSRVIGIASLEGVGKTRTLLDWARRIYLGLPYADGQPPTFAPGTKTIWLCSDGNQDEIAEALPLFGLPDDAIVFPAPPDDPYANTNLDSPETLQWLDQAIAAVKPALTIVDTLTYATARDLCEQRSVAGLKGPLIDLVQKHQTIIALLLHLSKDGQALGRRIKGITRTLMHLECPDPDQPERLRLWVEKSYAKKPKALGVTLGESGNTYDFTPPVPKEPNKPGRPPEKRDKAAQFIRAALSQNNDQVGNDLCHEWTKTGGSKTTFWRVVNDMADSGDLTTDGGSGTGKQTILHLNCPKTPKP